MLAARELVTILAALRHWQQTLSHTSITTLVAAWPHLADHESLSPVEIDNLCDRLNDAYSCEVSGPFCCGIPGSLGLIEQGWIDPDSVESCDACERYASDDAAHERLRD